MKMSNDLWIIHVVFLLLAVGVQNVGATDEIQVLGSIEVNTFESSLFEWSSSNKNGNTSSRGQGQSSTMYLLENIACSYSQHASHWKEYAAFANASYVRIRNFSTGEIVANITSTIGYGFITPFPDYVTGTLWLFGSQCNRCGEKTESSAISADNETANSAYVQVEGPHGCVKGRRITAWKLLQADKEGDEINNHEFQHWQRQRLPNTQDTYNVQVTAVHQNDKHKNLQHLPYKYVMIAEPFTIYINNANSRNLMTDWMLYPDVTPPPKTIPSGGPSIRHVGDGYFYIFTGGHTVELIRTTSNFSVWEVAQQIFLQSTPRDALIAPVAGFATVAQDRGFGGMQKCWACWDWNVNDADVAYTNTTTNSSVWLVWGAGTQGRPPKPPLTQENHCTNVVGVVPNMSLARFLQQYFVSDDNGEAEEEEASSFLAGV